MSSFCLFNNEHLFQRRHLHKNIFVYHSLASKSHVTCWVRLLLRMTPVIDFPASGQDDVLVCSVEIPVLMGTIGRKDLSCLIVPHCLDPQALCRGGALFCYGSLTTTCGFPPENTSASLQGSGHRFCGLCLPISRSQSCSGRWSSYNPPLSLFTCVFHMYNGPCTNTQV